MTPKEEAIRLVEMFKPFALFIDFGTVERCNNERKENAKQCALIAADLMLIVMNDAMLYKQSKRDFLQELKQEIESL